MLLTVYCVRRDLSEVTFSLQVDADFELHNFRALCELESGIPAAESQVSRGSERGLQPAAGELGGGGGRVLQPPVDAPTAARGARARASSPPHLLALREPWVLNRYLLPFGPEIPVWITGRKLAWGSLIWTASICAVYLGECRFAVESGGKKFETRSCHLTSLEMLSYGLRLWLI